MPHSSARHSQAGMLLVLTAGPSPAVKMQKNEGNIHGSAVSFSSFPGANHII